MKLFVISLFILAALAATVFLTARYAATSLDGLIAAVDALTPDESRAEDDTAQIRRAWKRAEKYYCLAIDRRELDTIDGLLAELHGAARAKNREEILIVREQLRAALERLKREVRPDFRYLL